MATRGTAIHTMRATTGTSKHHKKKGLEEVGIPSRDAKYRLCLGPDCDRMFPSTGPDHRICDLHKSPSCAWRVGAYGAMEGCERC